MPILWKKMTSFSSHVRVCFVLCCACLFLVSSACQDDDGAGDVTDNVRADQPLRPLIYTELPDLTPRAAAVRERRLMRELLFGSTDQSGKQWGHLKAPENLPPLIDEVSFGKALTRALLSHDEALWDHIFVSPSSYAAMVHVRPKDANTFVDELQAKSSQVWELFAIEHASEAPEGGLSSLFEFHSMTLGQGRTLSGKLARRKDDVVAQYWGNVLKVGLRDSDVVFEIRVPKILRVLDQEKAPDGQYTLAMAAPLKASSQLQMFTAAGMHLKPELLRIQEYPFPLAVGNFWRYRRFRHDQKPSKKESMNAMDAALVLDEEQEVDRGPGETLLEVLSVQRYQGWRLVKYRVSYDDQELTMKESHWLVSPRAIYHCSRNCVRHVEDLNWLLGYMQRMTPLYLFPIKMGKAWSDARDSEQDSTKELKNAAVSVASLTQNIEVPSGKFNGVYVVDIKGKGLVSDPFFHVDHVKQSFVRGQGVIRQEYKGKSFQGEPRWIIEELVESRIMP